MFNSFEHFCPEFFQIKEHLTAEQYNCYLARQHAYKERFVWSDVLDPVWNVCLVHKSLNVPGKVGYFANLPSLLKNRVTRTSPEMFLERFLQHASQHIKDAWRAEVLGNILPEIKFIENTDPDGWYNIYGDGPQSCMKGSYQVKQYAHPENNLALAYVERNGKIVARTIVNKKTKQWLNIYSKANDVFMSVALNKLGYHQSDKTFLGEIIYIEHGSCCRCDEDIIVGPYLDGDLNNVEIKMEKPDEGIIGRFGLEICYGDEPHCEGCD